MSYSVLFYNIYDTLMLGFKILYFNWSYIINSYQIYILEFKQDLHAGGKYYLIWYDWTIQ